MIKTRLKRETQNWKNIVMGVLVQSYLSKNNKYFFYFAAIAFFLFPAWYNSGELARTTIFENFCCICYIKLHWFF